MISKHLNYSYEIIIILLQSHLKMGDNQFNDSFDDSFDESSDEHNYEPQKYMDAQNYPLHDSEEESPDFKRPREDDMDLEQPVKKYKIDNANFMALYAKAHDKESK